MFFFFFGTQTIWEMRSKLLQKRKYNDQVNWVISLFRSFVFETLHCLYQVNDWLLAKEKNLMNRAIQIDNFSKFIETVKWIQFVSIHCISLSIRSERKENSDALNRVFFLWSSLFLLDCVCTLGDRQHKQKHNRDKKKRCKRKCSFEFYEIQASTWLNGWFVQAQTMMKQMKKIIFNVVNFISSLFIKDPTKIHTSLARWCALTVEWFRFLFFIICVCFLCKNCQVRVFA